MSSKNLIENESILSISLYVGFFKYFFYVTCLQFYEYFKQSGYIILLYDHLN